MPIAAVLAPPRRAVARGTTVDLLVLAAARGGLAAVDLASGALVRACYPAICEDPLRPFDVVRSTLGEQPEPDPTQPERVALADLPVVVGRLGGRRVDRLLRPLDHPEHHLLGCAGPTVASWDLCGQRPSMAVVPARPALRWSRDGELRCRFSWMGLVHDLPVTDRTLVEGLDAGWSVAQLIGGEPRSLLAALTPPRNGHCDKVVAALLPR